MKQIICTVYDRKSKNFSLPFYAVNVEIAERYILDSLRDSSSPLARWPKDFLVYQSGFFDDVSGETFTSPLEVLIDVNELFNRLENLK